VEKIVQKGALDLQALLGEVRDLLRSGARGASG
jgi:hypothetical protein